MLQFIAINLFIKFYLCAVLEINAHTVAHTSNQMLCTNFCFFLKIRGNIHQTQSITVLFLMNTFDFVYFSKLKSIRFFSCWYFHGEYVVKYWIFYDFWNHLIGEKKSFVFCWATFICTAQSVAESRAVFQVYWYFLMEIILVGSVWCAHLTKTSKRQFFSVLLLREDRVLRSEKHSLRLFVCE